MKRMAPGILAGLFFFVFPASATIIRVPQDQPTIQAGIDAAVNGDTVLVAPGVYSENIVILSKNIVLTSSAGPEFTIITPNTTGTPVVSIMITDTSTRFSGFTVQDGIGDGLADGIKLINSSARIENNIVQRNGQPFGGSLGTGLWASNGGSPKVINNTFRQNIGFGRTIEFVEVYPTLERNLVVENQIGVQVFVIGNITALNNTIARNPGQTFGLYIETGYGPIKNNIIANSSESGMYINVTGPTQIDYNDFYNNLRGPLTGPDASLGVGNITLNPLFIAGTPYDYHLQSHSPCIDAGDPSTPVPPKGGTRVDMGAFEFELGPAFTLISPANSNVEITQTPTFVWHKLADSFTTTQFSYLVIYDDTISFSSPDFSPSSFDTSYQVSPPLPYGKTFYWKVRAVDDSAQVVYSKDTRTFKIDSPPTTPTDISPDSGDVLDFNDYLIWLEGSDPDPGDNVSYQLQIDDDPAFANPEVDQSGITGNNLAGEEKPTFLSTLSNAIAIQLTNLTNHTNLKDDSTYFWRVRSVDNHSLPSSFTEGTRNFTLKLGIFQLGDANGDGLLTSADIVLILNFVFLGVPISPPEVADMNCDGVATSSDVVIALNVVFLGQAPPCDP